MNYTKDEFEKLVQSSKAQMSELGLPMPSDQTLLVDVQMQVINALVFRVKNLEQKVGAFLEQTSKEL